MRKKKKIVTIVIVIASLAIILTYLLPFLSLLLIG